MIFAASVLVALLPFVAAQTSTDCNPTEKSCPADPAFSQSSTWFDFQTGSLGDSWDVLGFSNLITTNSNGLQFSISESGESPTITSKDYVFFGRITAVVEAAQGAGIVSSVILQSDDLDEIDLEWLGGDTTQVQSNYFSKGDTSTYDRGGTHPVSNPQTTFHTYVIDWSETQIEWIIDGTVVRTLTAASVGDNYPQTPCQIRIGSWCGGCSNNAPGTIQWAGGPTTFGSTPYVMTVQSLEVVNYNPGGSYSYGDMSGSAGSIVISGATASNSSSYSPSSASVSSSTTSSYSYSTPSSSVYGSSSDGSSTAVTNSTSGTGTTGTTGSEGSDSTPVTVPSATLATVGSTAAKASYSAAAVLLMGMVLFLA